MVLPDHPTPLSLRTHTADPVPYIIYRKSHKPSGIEHDEFELNGQAYSSNRAKTHDRFFRNDISHKLMISPYFRKAIAKGHMALCCRMLSACLNSRQAGTCNHPGFHV